MTPDTDEDSGEMAHIESDGLSKDVSRISFSRASSVIAQPDAGRRSAQAPALSDNWLPMRQLGTRLRSLECWSKPAESLADHFKCFEDETSSCKGERRMPTFDLLTNDLLADLLALDEPKAATSAKQGSLSCEGWVPLAELSATWLAKQQKESGRSYTWSEGCGPGICMSPADWSGTEERRTELLTDNDYNARAWRFAAAATPCATASHLTAAKQRTDLGKFRTWSGGCHSTIGMYRADTWAA